MIKPAAFRLGVMSMTLHDVPFVVSLIWLAALSGGMIFLLVG